MSAYPLQVGACYALLVSSLCSFYFSVIDNLLPHDQEIAINSVYLKGASDPPYEGSLHLLFNSTKHALRRTDHLHF